jgi:hypothetical protein
MESAGGYQERVRVRDTASAACYCGVRDRLW